MHRFYTTISQILYIYMLTTHTHLIPEVKSA
jgi:hypothetical protein